MANQHPSPQEIWHRVNHFLNKLSDRDTELMAAAELSAIARTLSDDSLSPFISAVGNTRPTDKIPLRRHSLRILSLLARSIPSSSLSPYLPRLIAAVLRRLRDHDSSVRAALVDAVRSLAAAAPPATFVSTILRPIVDALFHEQDIHPQSVSALSLSASLEECNHKDTDELSEFLLRLVPRLVKLSRSPAFKAKPALLSLLGNASISASVVGDAGLRVLVNCLVEFIGSQDWAARNAAAMTLTRLAGAEKDRLSGFKSSCLTVFESRRYDKVKIVRESMSRLLATWKEIPDKDLNVSPPHPLPPRNPSQLNSGSNLNQVAGDGSCPTISKNSSVQSSYPFTARSRISTCRSSPSSISPVLNSNIETNTGKNSKIFDQRKKSDQWIEVTLPETPYTAQGEDSFTIKECDLKTYEQGRDGNNGRSRFEVKRVLFDKNWGDKKNNGLKSGSRVVPYHESGSSEVVNETDVAGDGFREEQRDDGLSLIRMQLVKIENQQSSLLNLLQRFMGSSQNGLYSLETRVRGLEMALDDMSRDIAASSARVLNEDREEKMCCRLPGTDLLSSKFWRRAESTYNSRLLTYKENHKFGPSGGFINPLAEASPQLVRNTTHYTRAKVV